MNDGGAGVVEASEPSGEGACQIHLVDNDDNSVDGGGGGDPYYALKQQPIDRARSQLSNEPLIAFKRLLQAEISRISFQMSQSSPSYDCYKPRYEVRRDKGQGLGEFGRE
eukprot:scaffold3993_cov81-Skeletonema_dohrnii-CCMP3373.AAC.4